jgi:hypothetical protein
MANMPLRQPELGADGQQRGVQENQGEYVHGFYINQLVSNGAEGVIMPRIRCFKTGEGQGNQGTGQQQYNLGGYGNERPQS